MSLALGLGLGLPFGGLDFSPARLFAANEPGFWGEVAPAYLWQDTARTTPVTADGDPVASWQLNTATGVIYATQSTAGNRPIYKASAGLHWLEFDGATSNRWLVTPTITPGTNMAQVFAGVRKLSDAASGVILETSVNFNVNNGAILMTAPNSVGASYSYGSMGTLNRAATYTNAAVAAPNTSILAGLSQISTDTLLLRVNGAQVASTILDQGTGNYLAYPLYIGSRGGTTSPFNGRIYGLIVRFGANLSAAQITQAESWMNQRTRAY